MMVKVQSSSMFLFWFLLECLLHVCLPYTDGVYPAGKAMDSPGSRQLQRSKALVEEPRDYISVIHPTPGTSKTSQTSDTPEPSERTYDFMAPSAVFRSNSWKAAAIPRRPGLVHVISISSIAFAIALICGLIISYMIYRLVKAEEQQQLAMLYEKVEIPLLDEKEVSEDEGQDESSKPHPENEELEKFIGSVIKTKRREKILKKKVKGEKNLLQENTSESSNYTAKVESHDKTEKGESSENL
ncbi:uncharacterized protein C19orf18 homolog [Microtus ochrogaster]|uniref:Uncharacterized protein C19orf18 homolog n=1 Tax=Microtus ochrogaster TaxID=79684 RepID=A0ABM0LSR4_MICOH|nr:uncharacterized protein C19orf18 homolog [Microtus ochrogaster]